VLVPVALAAVNGPAIVVLRTRARGRSFFLASVFAFAAMITAAGISMIGF
jgi:hypothetical protein